MSKLLKQLKPFTWSVILVIILTFASSISDLNLPNYFSQVVNIGISTQDVNFIFITGLKMMGFSLVSIFASIYSGYLSSKISMGVGRNMRETLFKKVETFSLAEFDSVGTSSLITRTTNDITQVQTFLMMFMRIVLMSPVLAIGGIIMAYNKNAQLSSVLLFSIPVLLIAVAFIGKSALPLSKSMQKKLDKVNLIMREKLTGIRVIRAFNTEEHETQRFNIANMDLTNTTIKMQRIMSGLMPVLMLVLNATTIAIIWLGGMQVITGSGLLVGDIIAVIQYVMQIMMSMMMLSFIFVMYPRAAASAERINEIYDIVPSIVDGERNDVEGADVEFKNVSFYFPHADKPALENISFTAAPGTTTAIIGSTGSGKSALINLIPRFYDASSGEITVGGVNVRDYVQKSLRNKIGYVPQKGVLFKGTVEENIKYGKKDATVDDVNNALQTAQASAFVEEKGLDYHIAQGGTNVSGGQKQRLSIARAIIRKPQIYIFDDSFSALDFKTDSQLRAALKNETLNATVIIVAQRVSTIMDADKILVLEAGKLVGIGKHNELLKSCSVYHEIVASQLSEEEMN